MWSVRLQKEKEMKELILLPMGIITNLLMVRFNLMKLGNRGETPVANPEAPPAEPSVPTDPPKDTPQPSAYESLKTTKGMKSDDEFAKSYSEAEVELGKRQTRLDTVKTQLESQGFTLDDNGNVVQVGTNTPLQPQNQQQQQYDPYNWQAGQGQGQEQQPIYDPYTGQQLTNPIDIQLAGMTPSQRMVAVANAVNDQREKQQHSSSLVENEVLSKPEAQGFEKDVRMVMNSLPLAQRSDKKQWEDALLRVKGMKYDEAMKSKGAEGVTAFLNKENVQGLPSGGSGGKGGPKLTTEQQTSYDWYKTNRPNMFKDVSAFLKASDPKHKG